MEEIEIVCIREEMQRVMVVIYTWRQEREVWV